MVCGLVWSDGDELSHASLIQRNCMFLVENLNVDLSALIKAGVLLPGDAQTIEAEKSSHARNYLLLKLLTGKSKDAFDRFLEHLRREQMHVYISLIAAVEGTVLISQSLCIL